MPQTSFAHSKFTIPDSIFSILNSQLSIPSSRPFVTDARPLVTFISKTAIPAREIAFKISDTVENRPATIGVKGVFSRTRNGSENRKPKSRFAPMKT